MALPRSGTINEASVPLSDRVASLIERHFDGNVSAAARAARLSQPALYAIVSGGTKSPSADTVAKLAGALGVPVSELIVGEGNSPAGVLSIEEQLTRIERMDAAPLVKILARLSLAEALSAEAALHRARAMEDLGRALTDPSLLALEPDETERMHSTR